MTESGVVPARSLAFKLAEVMAAIDTIARTGTNEHFKYKFIEEEEVSRTVRAELSKRHILLSPDVVAHEREGTLTILTIALRFIDGETGEIITQTVIGYGADNQDKGASKALTAGIKYGLIKAFLIPGSDDPDAHGPVAPARPAPRPVAKVPSAPVSPADPLLKPLDEAGKAALGDAFASIDPRKVDEARKAYDAEIKRLGFKAHTDFTAGGAFHLTEVLAVMKQFEKAVA